MKIKIALGVYLLSLFCLLPFQQAHAYVTARWDIDAPDYFNSITSDRSIAVDSKGTIYVVYGDDHLRLAKYDGQWSYQVLDTSPESGGGASMIIDKNDKIHIAYFGEAGKGIVYTHSSDGVHWNTSPITESYKGLGYASLFVADDGKIHVAYAVVGTELYYAWSTDGSSWTEHNVESAGSRGQWPSLAVDANGIHLSYYDAGTKDLVYALSSDGALWTKSTVDATDSVGQYTSLVVNSTGTVFISYFDDTNDDLKIATLVPGGTWSTKMLDDTSRTGYYSSLTIDDNNALHVVFYKLAGDDLRYATSTDGATWTLSTASSSGGKFPAVTTRSGTVHIRHFNPGLSQLFHTSSSDGVNWSNEAIADSREVGKSNNLIIDPQDVLHVAYLSNDDLYYSTSSDGVNWSRYVVDTERIENEDIGFAIDKTGKRHMTYYDGKNGRLKYAWSADGKAWSTSVIDETTDGVGYNSSLVIDSAGKLHVIYVDASGEASDGDVKYASSIDGSTWTLATVDNSASHLYSDLTVDNGGVIHSCYYDYENEKLKYASSSDGVTWSAQDVADHGEFCSIQIGTAGKIYIAYHHSEDHNLMLASTADGALWDIQTVHLGDTASGERWIGENPYLIIDAAGEFHISYWSNSKSNLKYAHSTDGLTWSLDTLLDHSETGQYSAIAINSIGELWVSYYDDSSKNLGIVRLSDCGDGVTSGVEQCDDGNAADLDGCSFQCKTENTWYLDADSDGFGIKTQTQVSATQPSGYVLVSTDCNDSASGIHPNATELCGDGVDQNCDGQDLICPTDDTEDQSESATGISTPNPVQDQPADTSNTDSGSITSNAGSGGGSSGCSLYIPLSYQPQRTSLKGFRKGILAL